MEENDLFAVVREEQRQRLREAGYREAGGMLFGATAWRCPGEAGEIVGEDEAMKRLARQQAEGAD